MRALHNGIEIELKRAGNRVQGIERKVKQAMAKVNHRICEPGRRFGKALRRLLSSPQSFIKKRNS
jgi:hypothetical protein